MIKDPDAVLPFAVDWSAWLANEGDTAASVTWVVPTGLTKVANPAPTLDESGKATVWLSGGTAASDYLVTCRMTTTGGRVDDRSIRIQIRDR